MKLPHAAFIATNIVPVIAPDKTPYFRSLARPLSAFVSAFFLSAFSISMAGLMVSTSAQSAESRGLSEGLSQGLSSATALSMVGSATIVGGSVAAVASTGQFVVQSVLQGGEGSVMVLKAVGEGVGTAVSDSAELSVKIGAAALTGASVVVGSALCIVRETAGWAIRAGHSDGKLVGYVVNDNGVALLRQQKLS